MSETKPFIFIEPLSDTLQKLKEVVMETASEEGIEIFTIEDMMEANQLIPSVGQSLIVCSNPKKCAAILQTNRKVINKLSSKVILLSPKVIPRKTLEKFMKVGLTECVVEPVPPKTLLYKVKLLLRSIATRKEEGDMEMRSIKGDEETQTNSNEKHHLEKGVVAEESAEDLYQRENKKSQQDVEADYDLNARSEKKAEEIDGHWSGRLQAEKEQAEKKKKESEASSVDYLESHYKGKLSANIEEDEEEASKKKASPEIEIDYDDFKEGTEDDLDFDIDDLKKKKRKAKVEEKEDKDLSADSTKEKIETHYKGRIGDFKIDEEEYDELTTGTDIDLDFDSEKKKQTNPEALDDEEESPSKKAKDLDLDFSEDKARKNNPEEQQEEDEQSSKKPLEVDLDDSDHQRPKREEESKAKKDPHTGEVDHIETMLKGHLDHTRKPESEDEDFQDKHESTSLEFQDKTKERDQAEPEDEDDLYEREKVSLEFTDSPDAKKERPEEGSEDIYERERSQVAKTTQNKERQSESSEDQEDEDEFERPTKVQLELVDNKDREKSKASDEEDDFLRTKRGSSQEAQKERERSPVDGHADHIQTYYKSGEGIKHVDDNWDNKYDRPNRTEEESGNREEKVLQMLAKENLGEQTIDYKRLKEQFDAISMGSDGKLKMADVIITDSGGGKKKKGPRYYREDITQQDEVTADEQEQEEEKLKNQIFSPTPAGLDFVIKMSNLFANKELKEEDFFNTVSEHLWDKFGAHCCFFLRRPEKSQYEIVFQKQIEEVNPESPQGQFSMEAAMESKFETWALMSLPYWLDHTFQSDKQVFFFPYTEGAQKIGFATVHFFHKVEEQLSSEIEVILESVRGIYLQAFHKTGLEGNYNQEKKEEPKKKTLLSKMMFWKKAG